MAENLCVLCVDASPFLGGAARSLLDLLSAFPRERLRPVLAASSEEVAAAAISRGIETYRVPFPPPTRNLLPWRALPAAAGLVRARAELWKLADRCAAGVLHSNSTWAHLATGDLLGLPSVWHCRDLVSVKVLAGRLADTAAAVAATSHAMAAFLAAEGVPGGVIRVIYNGVDAWTGLPGEEERAAVRRALRAEWGVPEEAPLAAWVGEFAPWKRTEDFLGALAELRRSEPQARGVVLGAALAEGHQGREAALIGLAGELGLKDAVRFAGWRGDLPRCLVAADLLLATSENEPFGRVLVEAMAAGLPAVARAGGGVAEVLGRDAGVLLESPSARDYAEAAAALLADGERRARLAAAGRRRARELFSPALAAEQFEKLYAEISGRGS